MGFNSGFKGLSWYELNNEIGTDDLVRGMLEACIGRVHLQKQPGN